MKRGILNQVGFGFNVITDTWKKEGSYFVRKLDKLNLLEISLLDCTAAYNNTAIEARSLVEVPEGILYEMQVRRLELYKLM